ncbi:MAG: glycoside hydrolase family 25 protein [Bacteroidota bacterium]
MKVKRVLFGSLSVLAVFVLCFVLVSYPTFNAVCRNVASKIHKTFSPTYPGWGISLPDNYEVHGIDVSRHQREIDWSAVSATKNDNISISFAFIKATEGRTVKDDYFQYNWREAKKNNILRGAYHFFRPHLTAEEQFKFFSNNVVIDKEDLPPVLDIEMKGSASPKVLRQKVKRWLDLAERRYGMVPILYTNYSFYKHYLKGKEFEKYPLWLAHYATSDLNQKHSAWHFWQHNESGRVNGIRGGVDFNVFNGDFENLMKLCKK